MYTARAPQWLAADYRSHYIFIPATERVSLEAWFATRFGQFLVQGARPTTPLPEPSVAEGVTIRQAQPEDLDTITRLAIANLR